LIPSSFFVVVDLVLLLPSFVVVLGLVDLDPRAARDACRLSHPGGTLTACRMSTPALQTSPLFTSTSTTLATGHGIRSTATSWSPTTGSSCPPETRSSPAPSRRQGATGCAGGRAAGTGTIGGCWACGPRPRRSKPPSSPLRRRQSDGQRPERCPTVAGATRAGVRAGLARGGAAVPRLRSRPHAARRADRHRNRRSRCCRRQRPRRPHPTAQPRRKGSARCPRAHPPPSHPVRRPSRHPAA
jgi:hypothetical protein